MWTWTENDTVIAGSVKVQVYKAHRNQMDNQRRRVFLAVPQASFVSFDPSALKPYDNSAVLAKLCTKNRDVRSVVINRLGVKKTHGG
jgi:hypothetical protein